QLMYAIMSAAPDVSMLAEAERPAVERALAKEPENRWPSCNDFVQALAEVESRSSEIRNNQIGGAVSTRPFPARKRRRILWAAAFALLVMLGTTAAWWKGDVRRQWAVLFDRVSREENPPKQAKDKN